LESALAPYGVEFPCGGTGACGGCRVRVLAGALPATAEDAAAFTPEQLGAGWRLACRSHVNGPLVLEVGQWTTPILGDNARLPFEPGEGVGIAIDLGTTTIVAQALDLETGRTAAVQTALNPQAAHGADVMSRVGYAMAGGAGDLTNAVREGIGALIAAMPVRERVRSVFLAGNTVMHHLFCGIDVAPLASAPFAPAELGPRVFSPRDLGWDLPKEAAVHFLPCLGGFVGSDILAGIMATGLAESQELAALVDLGTNGEIVVGRAGEILCASTAAGPAFEAGRISMGMRAAPGAIARVAAKNGVFECRVIGGGAARGICGSGLVDAAAAGLETGAILPNGRLARGTRELRLAPPVMLVQQDVRELQLAKGAIAAGLRILAGRFGADVKDIRRIYLAGAFGNYVDVASARRIGLLESDVPVVEAAGNTSLRGTKLALLAPSTRESRIARVIAQTRHVMLAAEPRFEDEFLECMGFASRETGAH
jgi:uncharacterized 2Fe-2S/4Fe-4S cluster protein (DUF4445 family)